MNSLSLLIGIEYINTPYELIGCENDIKNIYKLLLDKLSFSKKNIYTLVESGPVKPTSKNILTHLKKLVNVCNSQNVPFFFIYFSGHGDHIRDRNKDELDKRDEGLVPLDYQNGLVLDDTIYDILSDLNPNTVCFNLYDCCHSGSILDLPYFFEIGKSESTCYKKIKNGNYRNKCSIISLSGCQDNQTSELVLENGSWDSALTTAFINLINKYGINLTNYQALRYLKSYMKINALEQIPVLSTSWNTQPGHILFKPMVLNESLVYYQPTLEMEMALIEASLFKKNIHLINGKNKKK